MSNYKRLLGKTETRYVIEFASGSSTSAASVGSGSVVKSVGGVQRRGNLLTPVEGKETVTVPVKQKPRQGPLRPQTGAGQHRDKKKEQKQGKEKHRKPYMEGMDSLTFWKQEAKKAGGAANIDWYAVGMEHGKQGIVMNPPYGVGAKAVTLYGKGLDAGKQGVAEDSALADPNEADAPEEFELFADPYHRDYWGRNEARIDPVNQVMIVADKLRKDPNEVAQTILKFARDNPNHGDLTDSQVENAVERLKNYVAQSQTGVAEGSDYGEPQEVLADVMSPLERQVEWPLTDVMDPREVQSVLQPVRNAINKKLQSLEQGVAEGDNPEYDDEAGMADNNLETLKRAVQGLDDVINAGDNLPEWCQEKIAVAKSMLVTVWDYMLSNENGEPGIAEALSPEDEERQEIVDKLVFAAKATGGASRRLMGLAKDRHSDVADISNDGYAVVMNMIDQLKQYYDFSDIQMSKESHDNDPLQARADYAQRHGQGQVYKKTYPGDKVGSTKSYAYDIKRTGPRGQLPKEDIEEEKIKGVDGKACWKGKRYAGKVKKADGTYKDKCVPVGEDAYTSRLLTQLESVVSEKAVSKAQQKFMGMVHAVQKGEMKAPSKEVAKAAKGMSVKAGHDFAATKHKGLPDKKSKK